MITISVHLQVSTGRLSKYFFQRLVWEVLHGEGREHADISIIVLNDEAIQELNRTWLKHDCPTDVIAFPLEEGTELEAEVYISADTARAQAAEYRVPVREEFARLTVHGILHICGYDDHSDEDREEMRKLEDHYLGVVFGGK
jgi:rRNA maturation RNase YbeY